MENRLPLLASNSYFWPLSDTGESVLQDEYLFLSVQGFKPQMIILPRFIRLKHAPQYLGMDKNRFNREVRPHLTEILIGSQGIAFDRLDLDAFADNYKRCNGRPGKKKGGNEPWREEKHAGSLRRATFGTLTKSSEVVAFEKALAQATSRKQSVT